MPEDLIDVEIVQEEWGTSALRNPDSRRKQCCLGFVCLVAGYTKNHIYGKGMPDELVATKSGRRAYEKSERKQRVLGGLLTQHRDGHYYDSDISSRLSVINDDEDIPLETKKKRLKFWAKKAGLNFIFVSRPRPKRVRAKA